MLDSKCTLLLLMLEAAQRGPRCTISLKRSTQNSSAIHKPPADYPIFGSIVLQKSFCTGDQNSKGHRHGFRVNM